MRISKPNYKKEKKLKKQLEKEADELFKQIILTRHNSICEVCGGKWKITAHHYYYRSSASHLRYDLDNGICLDAHCHFLLHHGRDPKIIEDKIIAIRGQKWLNRLKEKAKNKPKFFKLDIKWYNDNIKKLQKREIVI